MIFGYARVSTADQNLDRQLIALEAAGSEIVYHDKLSGKDFERPRWKAMLRRLKKGDVLIVKSIDRLGRNYAEILEQWRIITKEKQVKVAVLDMPLLDTRNDRDLTGTLIADIVLQLLSYVAQTERESIRRRQAEGIAAAKARGVRFGREPIPQTERTQKAVREYLAGECSGREGAAYCGVSTKTFMKWVREASA